MQTAQLHGLFGSYSFQKQRYPDLPLRLAGASGGIVQDAIRRIMADNGNLTAKQKKAIACLLTEPTTLAAAEKAGVGYRTLSRWLTEADFKAALREAESAAIDSATRRLIGLESLATKALREILESPKAPAGVKVRAARSVLDYLLKLRELRNVEDRLTALETMLYED